jgi:hypothetical protein
LVIAVAMERRRERVQRTDHCGGRVFSLILGLFSLDLIVVQVSYWGQADTAKELAL